MKYLYNPKAVKQQLEAIFDSVRKAGNGYQHDHIRFIGQDVYEAALKAFPNIFTPKEYNASNDYSGHRAKMDLFAKKNKSRATFVPMYDTEIYLCDDGSINEEEFFKSLTYVLCLDEHYYYVLFKHGTGAIATGFDEIDDNRDYRNYLPYYYEEEHPWPAKGVSTLTDAKLDAWIGRLKQKQTDYDDIVGQRIDGLAAFLNEIQNSIDPEKCDRYEVGDGEGTIVANNLKLHYTVHHNVVHATVEVYREPRTDNAVRVFSQMTGTEKYTSPEEEEK